MGLIMNFEDFENRLNKELFFQAVSKQQLEEMVVLFKNLRELLSKSTSNPFYETYIFCFSTVAKSPPNLSLNEFRMLKTDFISMTLDCLQQINRSDDTPVLHELIEKFFIAYKKILYKKTRFTFFDYLKLKILIKFGLEKDETVFEFQKKATSKKYLS